MADVIIREMKMPKYTTKAEFGIDADGNPLCMIYHENETEPDIYDVIPLPEGHGRLGDCISREIAMSMPWANGQYDHEHANEHFIYGLETYKEWLEYVPAADVRPVIRAHWEWDENGMDWNLGAWKCSHCHCKAETLWATDKHNPLYCAGSHFCGNCGADMREERG